MDNKLLERLGTLQIYAFHDTGKDMTTVHFINEDTNKPDLMAYALFNGSWDLREVTDEVSVLEQDCEIITIKHERIGIYPAGSDFDNLLQKAIKEIARAEGNSEPITTTVRKLFEN